MKKIKTILTFITLATLGILMTTGCSTTRVNLTNRSTETSVALDQGNYTMVDPGASGSSYGFRLLGIIPFASPHYAAARSALYHSVKQPLDGKAIALANELEDRSTTYLILFSIPKITITADVIQFNSPSSHQPSATPAAKTTVAKDASKH